MAGRKQHFIPKSVLRGFLINAVGNDLTTWAFVKDRAPFRVSINNFAAERHFYSEASDSPEETLDDKITRHESEFAKALDVLRSLEDGGFADPRMVGEVISHLAIRGAFARDMFKQGAEEMIELIGENLSKADGMRALMLSGRGRDDSPFRRAVREEIERLRGTGINFPEGVEDNVVSAIDENFDSVFGLLQPQIAEFLSMFQSSIKDAARSGHVQALDQDVVPKAWLIKLQDMRWRACEVRGPLVLPDCIAVAVGGTSDDCMPFLLSGGQDYEKVFMPISSSRMLVGSFEDDSCSCDNFNLMAAKCSYTFFISAADDARIRAVSPSIGEVSRRFVSSTVEGVVAERFLTNTKNESE
jgi:hypothetical protein